MTTRLSNSQLNTFQICGKKYELQYKKRIKSTKLKSALLFGSAFDAASSVLFLTRDLEQAKTMFLETWKSQKDCKDIRNSKVDYFKSDLDMDLIPSDSKEIDINILSWESLNVKGLIMLEALNRDVLPRIGTVYATQEKISMINNEGDEIIGYPDLIAQIDGKDAILDVKTASSLYDEDAVRFSQQLTLYTHILEPKYKTRLAGYIVIGKKLIKSTTKVCKNCGFIGSGTHKKCNNEINGKRCNGDWNETTTFTAQTQIILEEINSHTEEIVLENLDAINSSIKNGVYVRNLGACSNQYGSCCEYFNLCHNKSMQDLEIKPETT
jgi:hypothetical protein